MKCVNCGTNLPSDALFCFKCGTKIENEKIQIEQRFCIGNRELIFNEDILTINDLHQKFSAHAWKCRTEFVNYYSNNVRVFDDLFDKAFHLFEEKVIDSVRFGVRVLMEYGIDYIDAEGLAEKSADRIDPTPILMPYINAAEKIQEQADILSGYRSAQRASRGKWQGGGFGVGGAIKGAITAGAFNIATGAFRGVGDSITNASDRVKISKMKSEIFDDPKTLRKLSGGLYNCCFSVFHSVWRILVAENKVPYADFNTEKTDARLNNYLSILKNEHTGHEQVKDVLLDCIQICPFRTRYYATLYIIERGNTNYISPIVKFFGLENEYTDAIGDARNNKLERILRLPENTAGEINKKIDLLTKLHNDDNGITVNIHIGKLKNILQNTLHLQMPLDEILQKIPSLVQPIDSAIKNENLLPVWDEIERGNIYAEFALSNYYHNLCREYYNNSTLENIEKVKRLLAETDVSRRAQNGNLFASYLHASVMMSMYGGKDIFKYLGEYENEEKKVIRLATAGNISAIASRGLSGISVPKTQETGLKLLQKAASALHPRALMEIGLCYKNGKCGLAIDKAKAKYYLSIAAAFGVQRAKEELDKLNSSSNSSSEGCFITTAVCQYLQKPDDCYELTMFRSFRDNWLKMQPDGRMLIQEYYQVAPIIVDEINRQSNKDNIYKSILDEYLNPCLKHIEQKQYMMCKDLYIAMVGNLKSKYCLNFG